MPPVDCAIEASIVIHPPQEVSASSISVDNSQMISMGSSNTSGLMSGMSVMSIRLSFQAILGISEVIEHKEKRGFFISQESLEQLQTDISNIGAPPRDESLNVDLDFSSFLDKSSRSIQRLEKEQKEQIQLLEKERSILERSNFEQKEESLSAEVSHNQSVESLSQNSQIICAGCESSRSKYRQLQEKYYKLKEKYQHQKKERDSLKTKIQRAGDIAKQRELS